MNRLPGPFAPARTLIQSEALTTATPACPMSPARRAARYSSSVSDERPRRGTRRRSRSAAWTCPGTPCAEPRTGRTPSSGSSGISTPSSRRSGDRSVAHGRDSVASWPASVVRRCIKALTTDSASSPASSEPSRPQPFNSDRHASASSVFFRRNSSTTRPSARAASAAAITSTKITNACPRGCGGSGRTRSG